MSYDKDNVNALLQRDNTFGLLWVGLRTSILVAARFLCNSCDSRSLRISVWFCHVA